MDRRGSAPDALDDGLTVDGPNRNQGTQTTLALLLLLVAVALGNLFGFKGSVLVVEGRAFSNTVTAYDEFSSGVGFDEGSLVPFTLGWWAVAGRDESGRSLHRLLAVGGSGRAVRPRAR